MHPHKDQAKQPKQPTKPVKLEYLIAVSFNALLQGLNTAKKLLHNSTGIYICKKANRCAGFEVALIVPLLNVTVTILYI